MSDDKYTEDLTVETELDAAAAPAEEAAADAPAEEVKPALVPGAVTEVPAPLTGTVMPLEDVTDPVFSSGAVGQGAGLTPTGDIVVTAPADGTVVVAPDSGHAFGINLDNGVELLIHVGLDTVNLKGEGFTPKVSAGERVGRGEPLVDADLKVIRDAGYDPTTILVVTNTASLGAVVPIVDGEVTTSTTVVEIDH